MKKFICIFSILAAVIITVCYMRIGGISGNASALSKVGLSHPLFFAVWGTVTYFALCFNICVGYSHTEYRFYIFLLVLALVGMALTLICRFDYSVYPQYFAHCIGSLTFSAAVGINIFLLFFLTRKYVLSFVTAAVLLTDLVLLIIYKETALIEVVPIFTGYALLLINNLKGERTEIAVKR